MIERKGWFTAPLRKTLPSSCQRESQDGTPGCRRSCRTVPATTRRPTTDNLRARPSEGAAASGSVVPGASAGGEAAVVTGVVLLSLTPVTSAKPRSPFGHSAREEGGRVRAQQR